MQHEPLTPPEPVLGERQAAQPVVGMGIDAGVEEHQIRAHLLQESRQVVGQQREVGVVLQPDVERHVQIAGLLA